MVTIRDYINKCKFVADNMIDEQERIIIANENKIISLNVNAFQDGKGSDGNALKNNNPIFDGVYSLGTQLIKNNKRAGDLYDFLDTGDFISNLQIDIQPSLTKFDIFSTGTGSGDKSIFFQGYTNLYGLDKANTDIVNYEIIMPELMNFIKKYL
jgi:hypothetical protein